MGCNTSVIVLNDALDDIERDPDFGKKLVAAIRERYRNPKGCPIDVAASSHVNAASVIETHHADHTSVVLIGGNTAKVLGIGFDYRFQDQAVELKILKDALTPLGYDLRSQTK